MMRKTISRNLTSDKMYGFAAPLSSCPRIQLANLPTPIESLARFSEYLSGPEIYMKRDDLTGLATGGNKVRKLEYLLGDALEKRSDTIITTGGPQSNHCRQTAAAAARLGFECHLVFGGERNETVEGNRFLDKILGANEHWTSRENCDSKMSELAIEFTGQGRKPYIIPRGGSNSIGALGYAAAMYELRQQMNQFNLHFDYIVFATSSGGTQAGITVGSKLIDFHGKLLAVSIDQLPDESSTAKFKKSVINIAEEINSHLNLALKFSPEDFPINYDFLGQGYGIMGEPEREAILSLARMEGILVDPVYTGKSLAGLISLVQKGNFKKSDKILFWHSGGEIALHAYVNEILGL